MRIPYFSVCFMVLCMGAAIPAWALTTLQQELIYRVSFGRGEDVKLLLNQDVDVNLKNEEGWPMLAIAADRTDEEALEVVTALVEAGADVNLTDKNKNYPIINATRKNNAAVVAYLIEHGADIYVRDKDGYTVRNIAEQGQHDEVLALIDAKIKADEEHLARLKSPQNLNKLVRDYAHYNCLSQYWSYYFASKQDPEVEESEIMARRESAEQKALLTMQEIHRLFLMDANSLQSVGSNSKGTIQSELENMVSNRNRKTKGVGQEADAEKRCRRIANLWTVNFTATPR